MARNKIDRRKIGQGEEWLEDVFLEKVLPLYFPGNSPQMSFSNVLNEQEFFIDNDIDAGGETIVFLTYKANPQQSELFNQAISKDYQKVVTPFEKLANEWGWDAQILGGDNDEWTFEVTIY